MVKTSNLWISTALVLTLCTNAYANPIDDNWHMIEREVPTQEATRAAPFEPLVITDAKGNKEVSSTFLNHAHVNLIANEHIYDTVKGDVLLADKNMKELENLGWTRVGYFSALEGKYLNFGDMQSGMLLYNPKENIYNVVWHGTAGSIKKENGPSTHAGWETNVDNDLIDSHQIPAEIVRTVKSEINSIFRKEKSGFAMLNFKQNGTINAIMKKMNSNINTKWNAKQLEEYSVQFMKELEQKLPTLAHYKKSAKDLTLLEKISASFQVKIALLKELEDSKYKINFEGKAHRGFTLKVASAMPQITAMIEQHTKTLKNKIKNAVYDLAKIHRTEEQAKNLADKISDMFSKEQLKNARVMNTGHSMAAGLTKVFTASFANHFDRIFKTDETTKNNRILVHALSSPLVGDVAFKNAIESKVGAENIYDQIVEDDLVQINKPLTYLPDALVAFLEKLPIIGPQLATQCDVEYADHIGTPAVDTAHNVFERRNHKHTNITLGLLEKLVYSHYGIDIDDGRGAHFDKELAMPLNGTDGYNNQLARGQQIYQAQEAN